MKKIIIAILMAFFTPMMLQAAGIGIYVPYSLGIKKEGTYTYNYSYQGDDYDYKYNLENTAGFGIAIASNLGKEKVFGYKLAFEFTSPEIENSTKPQGRLDMLHTFEFGIIRTKTIRVWIGARVNVAYVSIDNSDNSDDSYDYFDDDTYDSISRYVDNENTNETYDRYGFEYGIAPVIGINYNIGRFLAVSLDIDYKFATQAGGDDYGDFSEDVRGMTARFGVFFKFGERYNNDEIYESNRLKKDELSTNKNDGSSLSDGWD